VWRLDGPIIVRCLCLPGVFTCQTSCKVPVSVRRVYMSDIGGPSQSITTVQQCIIRLFAWQEHLLSSRRILAPSNHSGNYMCHLYLHWTAFVFFLHNKERNVPYTVLIGLCTIDSLCLLCGTNRIVRSVRKIAESDYWLRHICLSVRMEKLGCRWVDFHQMWHLSIFRKSLQKSVLLKIWQE
jgi:hypothetical protein